MRTAVALLIGIATLDAAGAQLPSRSPLPPAPQVVHIDVLAADARGRILDNLTSSDFIIRDDGVAKAIESVRFIRTSEDEGRLVAVFLDEFHVRADATARVRESMTRLVDALAPQDQLVVMKPLESLFTIRLSRDRETARQAIVTFEGRSGDLTPRSPYEKNFIAGSPARIEGIRTQAALSSLNALASHLRSYGNRRKTLIVVSDGMSAGSVRRGLEYLPTAETVMRTAQSANVAIYPVIPGEQSSPNAAVVEAFAIPTTGRAIETDLDAGLAGALADASGYYLLTFQANRPDDGRFHTVDVQVKRAGAVVRARTGYFAPSPDETLRRVIAEQANQPKPALALEPAAHVSTLIRPWFGTTRGANGQTRVSFVWEPAPRPVVERIRRVPTKVLLTVLNNENSVIFEGLVSPGGPGLIDEPGAAPARASFEAIPGRLRVRMSILDAAQQPMDSDVRSITVRDMRSGVLFGTPEILRARNAREFRLLDTPLSVPSTTREFSRIERLRIRFQVYGVDETAPPDVTARLFSRMGAMRDLSAAALPSGQYEIDLPLAGLANGDYVVELSAHSGGREVKDAIDFRVTG